MGSHQRGKDSEGSRSLPLWWAVKVICNRSKWWAGNLLTLTNISCHCTKITCGILTNNVTIKFIMKMNGIFSVAREYHSSWKYLAGSGAVEGVLLWFWQVKGGQVWNFSLIYELCAKGPRCYSLLAHHKLKIKLTSPHLRDAGEMAYTSASYIR